MFNIINKITKKEKLLHEEYSQVSEWILLHHLSGNAMGLQFSQVLNLFPLMPLETKIKLLESAMPKISYIKYPKKDSEHDKMIELIKNHFKINTKLAKEYYTLMSVDDLELLEESYNKGTVRPSKKKEN